jgi:hypothetical protein
MPRYFFDFFQAGDHSIDEEGTQFANAEEAYLDAFQAAREMWGELLAARRDPTQCYFEILSADRELLFVLPLQEVVESCRDRRPTRPFAALIHHALSTAGKAHRAGHDLKRELQSIRQTLTDSRRLLAEEPLESPPKK